MPKIPGRKSTRKTVPSTDGLLIMSFVMQHEEWLWRKPCAIEGCGHRMGPKTDEPGWTDWQPCAEDALPAYAVREDDLDGVVGVLCPCHVREVQEQDA